LARVASFSTDTRFGIVGNAASSLVKINDQYSFSKFSIARWHTEKQEFSAIDSAQGIVGALYSSKK
jgi:hypothetical protein